MNDFSTTSLYWILTNVILWLLEHLVLYLIKKSVPKKVLDVITDNKIDFTGHLSTVCKMTNLKLHALNRIFRFFSPEEHVLIINGYVKSLFNYCLLVWMLCYKGIMHKMKKIHEWSWCLLLKNYKEYFGDL